MVLDAGFFIMNWNWNQDWNEWFWDIFVNGPLSSEEVKDVRETMSKPCVGLFRV